MMPQGSSYLSNKSNYNNSFRIEEGKVPLVGNGRLPRMSQKDEEILNGKWSFKQ